MFVRLFVALAVLSFTAPASANAKRERPRDEHMLLTRFLNAAAAAGSTFGSVVLARPFFLQRVTTHVSSGGGGGAGVTNFRATDGTNTCDCSMPCTASQSTGGKAVACTGACAFPTAAVVVFSLQAGTCTSTQPSLYNIDFRGTWQ